MKLVQIFRITFIAILISALTACGGGGGKDNPPVNQTFSFAQVGPLTLSAGDVLTNVATGEGSGAVTYSSSNNDVATVNSTGLVTVVGAGDAVITAKKEADSKFLAGIASYTIHAVSISQTFGFEQAGTINLLAGATLSNPATGQGSGTITYSSSDPSVATVDSNGLVTVVVIGTGSTVITAEKAADAHYLAASASYTISASGVSQSLVFNNSGSFSKTVGDSFTNQAVGQGTGVVSYESSNPSVANVDANGVVTIVGGGVAEISAYKPADSHYLSATSHYTVYSQAIYFGQPGPMSFSVGASFYNQAMAQGSGELTYESSNTNVATVDNSGLITLVAAGSAVISATKAADSQYLAANASYTINALRVSQSISFAQSGPIDLVVGDSFTNLANALGAGVITYSSSDTSIATVDSQGVVSIVGAGSAEITATVAQDSKYLSAVTNYTVNAGIAFKAWVGSNNTLVDFSSIFNGYEFYRSTQSSCNVTNYVSCINGQFDLLAGATVTDTAAKINRTGYYVLKHNDQQAALTLKVDINDVTNGIYAPFTARYNHQVVVYKNKLWLTGGTVYGGGFKNDVWSSTDGIDWKLETAAAGFSARTGHSMVVFANKMWVIGGYTLTPDGYRYKSDVWSSTDGVTWVQEAAESDFGARWGYQVVVYQNQLWLFGGVINGNMYSDAWASSDGVTWTQKTTNTNIAPVRYLSQVVVFNNQLLLIGGNENNNVYDDVWSSTDGVSWTQQTAHASFPVRGNPTVITYGSKLWLVTGGVAYTGNKNEIWSSSDGTTWAMQSNTPPFTARGAFQLVDFDSHLMLIGGADDNGNTLGDYTNDVWSSTDGIEWRVGYRGIFKAL